MTIVAGKSQSVETAPKNIWTVLAIAVAAQTAGSFVAQGVYVMVPIWREAFDISLAVASLAVTFMNGGQIITMFLLGKAIDRHGERIVVSLMMLGMGAAAFLCAGLATSFWATLACMTFLGMTYAAVQPGGTRAIIRWFPPHRRGLATGFRQAAVPLGTALAAVSLPLTAYAYWWRASALLLGSVAVAGGAMFWAFYREPLEPMSATERVLPLRDLLKAVGQDPLFWPVLWAGVTMSALQFTLTAHVIGFLSSGLGLSVKTAASLFSFAQLLGIPGRILLPSLSDRWFPGRRIRSLAWTMMIAAATVGSFALLEAGTPQAAIVLLLILLGVFGIGWFPLYLLQVAEMAPRSSIASTVSLATTLCMIAMATGPFIFGLLVDQSGYAVAWIALVLPVAVSALSLLRGRTLRAAS